jgi:four helix bundle protein
LVEHNLAKVGVAGSNPVSRSNRTPVRFFFLHALVVELVDTQDLKSCGRWAVRVQVPSGVQNQSECESESEDTHSDFSSLSLSNSHSIMFDFEKLEIYKKAKLFNSEIRQFIKLTKLDPTTKDQLRRASFSIVLNIAEGSGRFTTPDRRNFYIISRSSIFECIAILDVLKDEEVLEDNQYQKFYFQAEEISKILFAMIKNLS